MDNSKIYSFSVKNEKDKELVERLKNQYARQGVKFSYIVIQALAEYESNRTAKKDTK